VQVGVTPTWVPMPSSVQQRSYKSQTKIRVASRIYIRRYGCIKLWNPSHREHYRLLSRPALQSLLYIIWTASSVKSKAKNLRKREGWVGQLHQKSR
jgi:hypothetical protein